MYKYECYLWFAERLNPNTSFWQLRWDLCFFFDSWNAFIRSVDQLWWTENLCRVFFPCAYSVMRLTKITQRMTKYDGLWETLTVHQQSFQKWYISVSSSDLNIKSFFLVYSKDKCIYFFYFCMGIKVHICKDGNKMLWCTIYLYMTNLKVNCNWRY